MTPDYLSAIRTIVVPALGNHLWQSTLFAIAAGLLTLALRKNHARARYWLWIAASVKFLVPFSLLIGLGSQLASPRPSADVQPAFYSVMEQVGRPFHGAATTQIFSSTHTQVSSHFIDLLPMLLAIAWLCGSLVVFFVWCVRWRRIAAATLEATPMREGREVEALRRLEASGGLRSPLTMRVSHDSLEPGIFGIIRPVLIWPAGISERLDDAHLEAILAHELWHVRRRDNLVAAIHMAVEAIFWFHPLVWWVGARMVEERERACDEQVLELGNEPAVYAESILKTCEFCVGSPLGCVSGVTGADLKKRIVYIMTQRVARKLDFTRKLLLSAAGLAAIAAPMIFGLLHASRVQAQSQPQTTPATNYTYDVASIKQVKPDTASGPVRIGLMFGPDNLSATNGTLQMLIRAAYGIQDFQISGAPDWVSSDLYDVEAKMDSSVADAIRKLDNDQRKDARQQMLQALLADRFKLSVHRETKELPVYALVVAKNGPKLQEAKQDETSPNAIKAPDGVARKGLMRMGLGELTGQGFPVSGLARLLSQQLGRTVIDKTGLTGNYDFTLHWTPDQGEAGPFKGTGIGPQGADAPPPSDSGPSIFAALQEQLGLKLESQKGPVEIIVIDHVEKPSEN